MVALEHRRYITPEEYLEQERDAECKSEYDDGVIVAMAGGSPEHAIVTFNVGVAIAPHLRRSGCQGYSSDMRVRIEIANRYYYPDFTAVCGQPAYQKVRRTVNLANPTLVVEVLSQSSERRDRGTKWFAYQTLASMQVYVLVHQDNPFVEWFTRGRDDDSWEYRSARGLGATAVVHLAGSPCELPLRDIYTGVEFPPEEPAQPEVGPDGEDV
ncbi:MAG TPA: Uma2 family endonuclease [Chthonomonadaceae bacterium]|nr:Uma2 family endonuclease [Chthonomonadaceae bacterium]